MELSKAPKIHLWFLMHTLSFECIYYQSTHSTRNMMMPWNVNALLIAACTKGNKEGGLFRVRG